MAGWDAFPEAGQAAADPWAAFPAADTTPASGDQPARITVRPQDAVGAPNEDMRAAALNIPVAYQQLVNRGLSGISEGAGDVGAGVAGLTNPDADRSPLGPIPITSRLKAVGDILAGLAKTTGGAIDYTTSPLMAPVRAFASAPFENVTGLPHQWTEFAANMAVPAIPRAASIPAFGREAVQAAPTARLPSLQGAEAAPAALGRAAARDTGNMGEALTAAQEIRPGVATLADVAGENVRGQIERIANTPGPARAQVVGALTERQQQQAARVSFDLSSLTGTRRSAIEATNATMAERATAARPLYETALTEGDRALWSPELERLSSSPTVRSAMQGAVRVWRDNAIADGYGAMNPGAMIDRGGQLSFLSGKVPVFPNLQFWDYTKRMLDDRVRAALNAGQDAKARTLTQLTGQLRTELDAAVPSYQTARDAWSGPSQYLDAIQEGAKLTSPSVGAAEVRAALADMTEANREAYVTGAISSIFRRLGNDASRLPDLTKYLRSPEMRAKVGALMPTPEAASQWERRLNFEVQSSELTGRALGNSRTAVRQAEQADAQGVVNDLIAGAMGHGHMTLLRRAISSATGAIRGKIGAKSDAEIADMLTNPASADRALNRLRGVGRTE